MAEHNYPGIDVAQTAPETFESAENFQLLVDAVRDYAIFMLDPMGHVRTWNSGAQRSKGYLAHEIIGQHFSIFYTPEDRLNNRPDKLLRLATQQGRVEDEGWRLRKDGARFWADVILTPLFAPDGKLRGFAKITRDMTEKRNMILTMEEALSASKAKSAFLANMSHELRTPLNAIIGYAELLEEQFRDADKEASRDMQKILYSGRHLLSIINDVLDLSRIESGHLELNLQPVDLMELAREIVENSRPLAERNGNVVKLTSTAVNLRIQSDPVRLRQVLYNLYSNACKFTKDGRIDIGISTFAGEVEIRVTDTGVGMSPDHTRRIFDTFYQVEPSVTSEGRNGTGLGLAISRLLVESMGGLITVSSTLGQGSSFSIRLPNRQLPLDELLAASPD